MRRRITPSRGRNLVPPASIERKLSDRLMEIVHSCAMACASEIGCAEGTLAARVKAERRLHYTGVEPSEDAEAAARVLDRVLRGTSERIEGRFDLLLAFHVLEHIPDAVGEVRRWCALLDTDGTIVVEVPEGAGHRLLTWDAHVEHFHYFTAASLAALFQRSGFRPVQFSSGHFESVVYPDCLRLRAVLHWPDAARRAALLARFRAALPGRFAVYGLGGDFRNYVEPLLDSLNVAALIDSNPERHGQRVGEFTVVGFDPSRHGQLPILISSVRFKDEIAASLQRTHAVPGERIVGLDDVYGDAGSLRQLPQKC